MNNLLGKRGRSGDISIADKNVDNTEDRELSDSDSEGDDVDKRERR